MSQTELQKNIHRNLRQCIYIGSQVRKKDVSTIFHSPFKDGKKNPQFNNPTFMSSDVFYGKISEGLALQAVVQNINDKSQKALHAQRLQRSRSFVALKCLSKTKKCTKKQNNTPKSQMQKELQLLMKFKKNKLNNTFRNDNTLPIYLQKDREYSKQMQNYGQKRLQIKKWIDNNQQLKTIKRLADCNNRQRQYRNIAKSTNKQKENQTQQWQNSRRNAQLLSKILEQQIANKKISIDY